MPDELRVFISSTFSDLKDYRETAINTLRRFGLFVVTLETFGATGDAPVEASARAIAEADIVVCILAHRLGYISPDSNESLLELEYNEAIKRNKPILVFLLNDRQPWPIDQIDFVNQDRLQAFKRRLMSERTVGFFSTPAELSAILAAAVSRYSRQVEAIPLERKEAAEPAKVTLADLLEELKRVRVEMSALQQVLVVSQVDRDQKSYEGKTDSILQPADFLGTPSGSSGPLNCFVIMPYSERWSDAIPRTILEVCQKVGFEFTIAKNMEGRFIPNDIWRGITGAGLIIADLSGANPNVTYEIGLADVLGKDVVLISQGGNVPFDFLGQRLITYQDSIAGALSLREDLESRLVALKTRISDQSKS